MLKMRIGSAWRISVLLPLIGCSACAHMAQDNWTGRDKAEHFLSAAALVMAGSAVSEHQNVSGYTVTLSV